MNHRITILKNESYQNELGDYIQQWADFKTVWAAIRTVQGREYVAAAAIQAENTYRFIIRHTTGIKPSMRVSFEGRIFDIESVLNDDEANKTVTIIGNEKL